MSSTEPTKAALSLRTKRRFHSGWTTSWQSRTVARAAANGQLKIAVMPTVENIMSVLLFEGGCKAKACASVTPYIAKLEGR
jgi:hypothetical protein